MSQFKPLVAVTVAILALATIAFGMPQKPLADPYDLAVTVEPCEQAFGVGWLKAGEPMTITVDFLRDTSPAEGMLYFVISEAHITDEGIKFSRPMLWFREKTSTRQSWERTWMVPEEFGLRAFVLQVYVTYNDGLTHWAPMEGCIFLI